MPTPGTAAQYYARKRRRKKQDQKDFDIAGYFAAPFDFGAVLVGGSSANTLVLPADVKVAIESTVALAAGDIGVENVAGGITHVSALAAPAGAVIDIFQLYREDQQIRITRSLVAPAATITVYFRGPKSQLIQIGTATFT